MWPPLRGIASTKRDSFFKKEQLPLKGMVFTKRDQFH